MQRERIVHAARYLPEDENWRPQTWRHFRYSVLQRLRDHGAQSIDEIAAAPPWVLFLPLNRAELFAIVDSARRLGLIAPLDSTASAEMLSRNTQWVVTQDGRRTIRHGLSWIFDKLGANTVLKTVATLAVGLLSATAFIQWLDGLDTTEVALGAELGIFFVWGVFWIALASRSRSAGAEARRTTSQDWQRWRRERSQMSEIAEREFPRRRTLTACLAFVLLEAALVLLGWNETWFQPIPWLGFLVFAYPAVIWFARWNVIEELAIRAELGEH
jgi:hypothetical protein